mgnify:CR=1 FL=1
MFSPLVYKWVGLKEPAKELVKQATKEEVGKFACGPFNMEPYPNHKYTFPDGRVYTEEWKYFSWKVYMVYFAQLLDENGRLIGVSEWHKRELEAVAIDMSPV